MLPNTLLIGFQTPLKRSHENVGLSDKPNLKISRVGDGRFRPGIPSTIPIKFYSDSSF